MFSFFLVRASRTVLLELILHSQSFVLGYGIQSECFDINGSVDLLVSFDYLIGSYLARIIKFHSPSAATYLLMLQSHTQSKYSHQCPLMTKPSLTSLYPSCTSLSLLTTFPTSVLNLSNLTAIPASSLTRKLSKATSFSSSSNNA